MCKTRPFRLQSRFRERVTALRRPHLNQKSSPHFLNRLITTLPWYFTDPIGHTLDRADDSSCLLPPPTYSRECPSSLHPRAALESTAAELRASTDRYAADLVDEERAAASDADARRTADREYIDSVRRPSRMCRSASINSALVLHMSSCSVLVSYCSEEYYEMLATFTPRACMRRRAARHSRVLCPSILHPQTRYFMPLNFTAYSPSCLGTLVQTYVVTLNFTASSLWCSNALVQTYVALLNFTASSS
jgi:hypothetical protein